MVHQRNGRVAKTMKIPIQSETPTQEGRYLFRGRFTGHVDLVTVRKITHDFNGNPITSYLGVMEWAKRDVGNALGKWSEKLEFD